MKCDGTHTTLKPSQMSVARITVVRGYVGNMSARISLVFI